MARPSGRRRRSAALVADGTRLLASWSAERRWLLLTVGSRALQSVPATGRVSSAAAWR